MPGPMSAPNGAREVVVDAKKREALRKSGKLHTGKTEVKRNK